MTSIYVRSFVLFEDSQQKCHATYKKMTRKTRIYKAISVIEMRGPARKRQHCFRGRRFLRMNCTSCDVQIVSWLEKGRRISILRGDIPSWRYQSTGAGSISIVISVIVRNLIRRLNYINTTMRLLARLLSKRKFHQRIIILVLIFMLLGWKVLQHTSVNNGKQILLLTDSKNDYATKCQIVNRKFY